MNSRLAHLGDTFWSIGAMIASHCAVGRLFEERSSIAQGVPDRDGRSFLEG
jgi:hypothetical protein